MTLLFWSWNKSLLQRELINLRKWNKHESVNGPNCSWKTSACSSCILAVDQFAMLQIIADYRPLEMGAQDDCYIFKPPKRGRSLPNSPIQIQKRREISQKQLRCINHGDGTGNDGECELFLIYIYPSTVKGISLEMNFANNYSHHHFNGAVRKKSSRTT